MGFQVYNSQGQELQNLTGTAGGDLTGTYPNPTLATAVRTGLVTNLQSTTKTTAFSTTSTTFTDVTGLSVSITPSATTSKVLIVVSIYTSNSGTNLNLFNLLRGSTNLAQPSADTFTATANAAISSSIDDKIVTITYLDSPSTTSATTYKIQARTNAGTLYVCRRGDSATVAAASTITAVEIL